MTSYESLNRHHFGDSDPGAQLQLSSIESHGPGTQGKRAIWLLASIRWTGDGWGCDGPVVAFLEKNGEKGRDWGGEGMGICSFVEALVKEKKQFNWTKMKLKFTGPRWSWKVPTFLIEHAVIEAFCWYEFEVPWRQALNMYICIYNYCMYTHHKCIYHKCIHIICMIYTIYVVYMIHFFNVVCI